MMWPPKPTRPTKKERDAKRLLENNLRVMEASQARYMRAEKMLSELATGPWWKRLMFGPKRAKAFFKYIWREYDIHVLGGEKERTGGSDA